MEAIDIAMKLDQLKEMSIKNAQAKRSREDKIKESKKNDVKAAFGDDFDRLFDDAKSFFELRREQIEEQWRENASIRNDSLTQ